MSMEGVAVPKTPKKIRDLSTATNFSSTQKKPEGSSENETGTKCNIRKLGFVRTKHPSSQERFWGKIP